MNPELHKILLDLDRREFLTEDYFKWSEEEKNNLTEDIVSFFIPIINLQDIRTEHLIFGLYTAVERAEQIEDYEQAEILNRCYRSVLEKLGLDDIY